MASITTLTDKLNNNTYDTSKWTKTGNTANVNLVNNDLEIIVPNASTEFNYYGSNTSYDWTSAGAFVHIKAPTTTTIVSQEAGLLVSIDATNRLWMFVGATVVKAYKLVAGVQTQIGVSLTYNSTTHAYMRIRESGGTWFFDTAPDINTWTNRWSLADPFSGNKTGSVWIYSQHWQSETTTTTDKFDSFNTPLSRNLMLMGVGV